MFKEVEYREIKYKAHNKNQDGDIISRKTIRKRIHHSEILDPNLFFVLRANGANKMHFHHCFDSHDHTSQCVRVKYLGHHITVRQRHRVRRRGQIGQCGRKRTMFSGRGGGGGTVRARGNRVCESVLDASGNRNGGCCC